MPKSPVPQEIRVQYIKEGLELRQQGKSQPDLKYNGYSYFLDNKGKNHGGWRLRNRASHSAQGAQRRAQTRDAVLSKADYQNALGKRRGAMQYMADKKLLQKIWASRGTPNMDVDHIHSLGSGGLEHPNIFRLQNSKDNRSQGARKLTPYQKTALMLTEGKTDQIKLQGPKTTPKQRQTILRTPNFSGASARLQFSSGSEIIDRVNGSSSAVGYAATLGIPLDLF